jgi:Zn-dependent protease with chaperone function
MSFGPLDWMLTYLLHSTVLLGGTWVACRFISAERLALREALWRLALVGGLITSTLQLATGIEGIGGSWSLADIPAPAATSAPAADSTAGTLPEARARGAAHRQKIATATQLPRPARALESREQSAAGYGALLRAALVGGWAVVASSLLLILGLSYLSFRRRLADRRDLLDGPLPAVLRRLERCPSSGADLPPARLTTTERIGVALARGIRRPEICLPDETLDALPIERHEIVLAHELAHLHRRDPIWFATARILEHLFFFQPLNTLARRRLQELSEFRCDDWAVAVTRRPISLAKCLTEVAERSLRGRSTVLAPTMSANKTHLGRRVARLLKRSYPMPSDKLPRWLAPAALALLALTVVIAPAIRASAAPALTPDAVPAVDASTPAPEAEPQPPDTPSAPPAPESRPDPVPAPADAPTPPTAPEAGIPAPPAPPAPPEHVHEDGWVFPSGDFVAELADFAVLASEFEASAAAAIAGFEFDATLLAAEHAELAAEWVEALEFDEEQVESLQELSEQLERVGYATEAETARLAEMAERLVASAEPALAHAAELQALALEMAEIEHEALTRHTERVRAFEEEHREEIEQMRREVERSLRESAEERRELIERAREAREEARMELDRERREELRRHRQEMREEMQRMRRQLQEQLRELDRELERPIDEGTADRTDEDKQ